MEHPELVEHIKNQLAEGLDISTIQERLRSKGWKDEIIMAACATEMASRQVPPVHRGVINFSQHPNSMEVDPGYLRSFSWGYFGTYFAYAIAMRLTIWAYVSPILYGALWFLIRVPVAFIFAFIPFGTILFVLLNIAVPLYIMYFLSHRVRQSAYQRRKWKSDGEFIQTQEVWDTWGKIIFPMVAILAVIAGGIAFSYARAAAQKSAALSQCVTQAQTAVYGPGKDTNNFQTDLQEVTDQTAACMDMAGYTDYASPTPTPDSSVSPSPEDSPTPTPTGTSAPIPLSEQTNGWKTFTTSTGSLLFSFKYPANRGTTISVQTNGSNTTPVFTINEDTALDDCPTNVYLRTGSEAAAYESQITSPNAYTSAHPGFTFPDHGPFSAAGFTGVSADIAPSSPPNSPPLQSISSLMINEQTEVSFETTCLSSLNLSYSKAILATLYQTLTITSK